ncbi:hypothetical protein PoB_001416800 [Plakobranchus ocellatus]|uniref:Secreted protein n=1 Tax=Plakobranchus ocellatus TaxID=259542 RepID=A0AAV3YYR9_9GAST|nr:hypothetical protein PoB_001416800 [Plakobranchus ocellatus]
MNRKQEERMLKTRMIFRNLTAFLFVVITCRKAVSGSKTSQTRGFVADSNSAKRLCQDDLVFDTGRRRSRRRRQAGRQAGRQHCVNNIGDKDSHHSSHQDIDCSHRKQLNRLHGMNKTKATTTIMCKKRRVACATFLMK